MQAIEFMTATQDGIIQIPSAYKDWFGKSVRVILLSDINAESFNEESDNTKLQSFFDRFNADLTGFKFSREEVQAR